MNALTPSWSIGEPCEESMLWLQRRLSRAGMRLLRTFDLQDARTATVDCQCPHHGTSDCDCQMTVVLVYVEDRPPVTLVVHGNNGQTWISVVDRPGQRADLGTIQAIRHALEVQPASEP